MRLTVDENVLPEQVKAARALLAWSQQELARNAHVATSTVADFERGVRTPMANNSQAIREAFENEGLQFVAGGVVERSMFAPPAVGRPGGLMRWVDATDLTQWGERRDAQSTMAELLRRLIFATVGPAADVRFPSDESVQHGGWDGQCRTTIGSSYVPYGDSGWEIGTQRTKIRSKANEDIEKRSEDPLGYDPSLTTFVFVTPHRFSKKAEWVTQQKARRPWREIIAIDGDDLVHWLEMYPAVAQWLAVKIGCRPSGLRNIEEVWSEWIGATTIPFTPDVLLTGRDEDQAVVLKWLREPPKLLSLQADDPEEVMAFLYAAISPLPDRHRMWHWGRCVVVANTDAARQLVGLGTPLIVVLSDPEPGLAQRLVSDGHHALAAFGSRQCGNSGNVRQLHRPWKSDLRVALENAGMEEEAAHTLAHASGRSFTVLRRLKPVAPHAQPSWAKNAPPELMAAMFAGAWSDTNSQDRMILGKLADQPYEKIEEVLAPLAASVGGPIVRSGSLWRVVSLRDLWMQIGGQITSVQLERFDGIFLQTLGAINPRFATRPKSPLYEVASEFDEQPTGAIRSGLTEAAIAMAVLPDGATLVKDIKARADRIVRQLLDDATPALWWSLSDDFRNLAEAAPAAFLQAIEAGLEGDNPTITSLFRSDEGMLHRTEYLANLLWALEILARSPDYLARVALVLVQLHKIDPGGEWGNRPFPSLRRIFVSWSPQTYANSTERLKVVDTIVRFDSNVGWDLLLSIAPRFHDISEPSAKPAWRDFAPDEQEEVALPAVIRAISHRLLLNVGNDVSRWLQLLDIWQNFEIEWRERAAQQLTLVIEDLSDRNEKSQIREKLRGVLTQHRAFADAPWAMDEGSLRSLDAVFDRLQPADIQDRVRWLFCPGALQLGLSVDFEAQQHDLVRQQDDATELLLKELTEEQLLAFASTITMKRDLGVRVACSSASATFKSDLMKRGLSANDPTEIEVGLGVFYGLKVQAGSDGESWVRGVLRQAIEEEWGEDAELHIVQALPVGKTTWDEIAHRSCTLDDAYWRTLQVYWIPGESDAHHVVEKLLKLDRAVDAVGWLAHHIKLEPAPQILAQALLAAARISKPLEGNAATTFCYNAGVILDYLNTNAGISEREVAGLEFAYFEALRYMRRSEWTLHKVLARDPEFFVYLMKLIYLPEEGSGVVEDEPSDVDAMNRIATNAFNVLDAWSCVPGATAGGEIDGPILEGWVKQARKLLSEAGRSTSGDRKIGEILSAAKRRTGEPWPPEAVRDVIEVVRSRELERGFEIGLYNRRGVTTRMPRDGGALERALAGQYRADAKALRFDWPRTAACLERIAESYEEDASREDIRVEQREWF
ncbi:helix-turn-helix transcriptional regulator [Burkholderia cenocepacia]|nr:helix-turn-helix transcriptional regulator [Burkholderia cenocepacia]MBR8396624.1 helix-turn-helix transcriptional regulator [Burkholderia cenocepacia]